MGIKALVVFILIIITAFTAIIIAASGMKGRPNINRHGGKTYYKLSVKERAIRITAIVIASGMIVADIGVAIAKVNRSNGGLSPSVIDALAAAPTVPETPEESTSVSEEATVHEAISLTQDELDLLTAGHSRYLSRNSMPSNSRFRKLLAGGDFSGAVSFTLKMAVDGEWFNEMHGISLTNPDTKEYAPEEIEQALSAKIEEWVEEYKDLPANKLYQKLMWRICDEILRNPIFGDMVNQFMASEEYFTRNNDWVIGFRDFLDNAYKQTNGILSVCEYEEGVE